ncbi:LacI family DNA-binding transcriptional regulator [Aurantiacibacter sp. D1-12]|uniref:LacI family DNA-binding transcriptional regulator n=1 Tax=Aurantiacibacter sp. D1-12 TaxID=2993658 RepID=UPI00237D0310|nr:LacI family DNA-binding transcriptional regulator [Aurantiacibacter sp. D1-12]MDE1466396.1 LacI family DNA-binding transcriptional regulator [Aurantiacibacter sp. D1-12]
MPNQTPPTHRVTSFEVAERAGVNQSTVSRALSGDTSITDATREKVRQAADELGYRVDSRAARLRSGKTSTIAIVVITKPGVEATGINPFHYNLLGSVCAAASDKGYQALVSFQSSSEQFYSDFVETRQADAVVLIGTSTNDAAWAHHHAILNREDVACWGSPYVDHRRVDSDNREGARVAVQRLLDGGNHKIAFIGDTRESQPQFRERYDAYCTLADELGFESGPAIFEEGETRAAQGRRSARSLIESGRKFDGIFCSCDAMAFGVLEVLREKGLAVPDDVSVIGFDGLGSGAHSSPPLTTIEPDFARAGVLLVEFALGETAEGTRPRAPVRLVERQSVKKPG